MNKLFIILISCMLTFPALAIEGRVGEFTQINDETLEKLSQEDAKVLEDNSANEELTEVPKSPPPSPFKVPISRKQMAKKLLIAMACVVGSSVFLYGVLSIYNKFRSGMLTQSEDLQNIQKPLDSPMELNDAIKSFIEKTRW